MSYISLSGSWFLRRPSCSRVNKIIYSFQFLAKSYCLSCLITHLLSLCVHCLLALLVCFTLVSCIQVNSNIYVMTINSRWKYASKKGSVSSYNVSQSIKKSPRGYPSFNFSRHVFQTLEKFIASGDANFIDEHIPTTIKRRVRKNEWYDQEQSMVCIQMYVQNSVHIQSLNIAGGRKNTK